MELDFSNERLDISCPFCGKKISETLVQAQMQPQLTCRWCGTVVDLEAGELARLIEQFEQAKADAVRRAGKRSK